jgi:hypothetical protein
MLKQGRELGEVGIALWALVRIDGIRVISSQLNTV